MTDLTDEAVKALLDGVAQNPPMVCVAWCGKAKDDCDCYKAGVAVNALNERAPDLARALLDARADAQAAAALAEAQDELTRQRELIRKAYHALNPDRPTGPLANRLLERTRYLLEAEVRAHFPGEVDRG